MLQYARNIFIVENGLPDPLRPQIRVFQIFSDILNRIFKSFHIPSARCLLPETSSRMQILSARCPGYIFPNALFQMTAFDGGLFGMLQRFPQKSFFGVWGVRGVILTMISKTVIARSSIHTLLFIFHLQILYPLSKKTNNLHFDALQSQWKCQGLPKTIIFDSGATESLTLHWKNKDRIP